jgi:hypothetical protein
LIPSGIGADDEPSSTGRAAISLAGAAARFQPDHLEVIVARSRYGTTHSTRNDQEPIGAAGVRSALKLPAATTLPGRAVLALDGWLQAEQHWQRTQPQTRAWQRTRAADAARHARHYVPRLLEAPELATVRWRGYADGTASAVVDGLWLWYARGQVFLAVGCPAGGETHLARLHSLVELGELVAGATLEPPPPPWSCTALCPSPTSEPKPVETSGRVVFVAGARTPTEGGLLDTRFVTDEFQRAREVLTGLVDAHVRLAFTAGQLKQARELAAVTDAVPTASPERGCWQAAISTGAHYWLDARTTAVHAHAEHPSSPAATDSDGAR